MPSEKTTDGRGDESIVTVNSTVVTDCETLPVLLYRHSTRNLQEKTFYYSFHTKQKDSTDCLTCSPEWVTSGDDAILEVQGFNHCLNLSQVDLRVTKFLQRGKEFCFSVRFFVLFFKPAKHPTTIKRKKHVPVAHCRM